MRIIFELGAIGWFVLLALKVTIAWMAYQALRRARSVFEFAVAVPALSKGMLHIVFPVVFNVTSAVTYWTVVGLLLYVWSCQELREKGAPARTLSGA
jgi:cell division protein FtsW (lipid II flippase)